MTATPGQPAPASPHLECTVCASGVTSPHGLPVTADGDGYPDSELEMDLLAYQRNGDDERDDQ